jgi:hypothetical protein
MTEAYPRDFFEQERALVPERMQEEDRDAIESLAHNGYEVKYGLTAGYAGSIAVMAMEPEIAQFHPDDHMERFTTIDDTERWLEYGRAVFLLLKHGEYVPKLAGYGWTSPQQNPAYSRSETHFAMRISEQEETGVEVFSDWKLVAAPFGRLIIAASRDMHGAHDFWLETWQQDPTRFAYDEIGFKVIGNFRSKRAGPSHENIEDTRLFMTMP